MAAYWAIGDTMTRFFRVKLRSVNGENRGDSCMGVMWVRQGHKTASPKTGYV
jgi:hypothetical protein